MIGIIPAAGKGTRLLPNTRAYPKELINFCGKPFIEYCLDLLVDLGIDDVCIIVSNKKGALTDYIGNGSSFGVNATYAIQEEQKGLGHAVLTARNYVKNSDQEDFVLLLGDDIIKQEENVLNKLIDEHLKKKPLASILVEETEEPEKYGIVKIEDFDGEKGKVEELFEKPEEQEKQRFEINGKWYAYCGFCVLNKRIFDYLEKTPPGKKNEIQLTDAIQKAIESGETVFCHVLKGKRIDAGSWDYLEKERTYYSSLSDKEMEEIIKERKKFLNSD